MGNAQPFQDKWFQRGNVKKLRKWLKKRDVDHKNPWGNTAVHWACWYNQKEMLKVAFAAGANINIQNNGLNTPLHLAIWNRAFDCADFLIRAGAELSLRNSSNQTPLQIAEALAYDDMAAMLRLALNDEEYDWKALMKEHPYEESDEQQAETPDGLSQSGGDLGGLGALLPETVAALAAATGVDLSAEVAEAKAKSTPSSPSSRDKVPTIARSPTVANMTAIRNRLTREDSQAELSVTDSESAFGMSALDTQGAVLDAAVGGALSDFHPEEQEAADYEEPTVDEYIDRFALQPHPDGGFYVSTHVSSLSLDADLPRSFSVRPRPCMTSIYYLLRAQDMCHLHRLPCDEVWHFCNGDPLSLVTLSPEGVLQVTVLGWDVLSGHVPQYAVPAGTWFGAFTSTGGHFSFVGCTCSPGFDFNEYELAQRATLVKTFPQHQETIEYLTRPPSPSWDALSSALDDIDADLQPPPRRQIPAELLALQPTIRRNRRGRRARRWFKSGGHAMRAPAAVHTVTQDAKTADSYQGFPSAEAEPGPKGPKSPLAKLAETIVEEPAAEEEETSHRTAGVRRVSVADFLTKNPKDSDTQTAEEEPPALPPLPQDEQ